MSQMPGTLGRRARRGGRRAAGRRCTRGGRTAAGRAPARRPRCTARSSDFAALLGQHPIERLGLGSGAREAVEDGARGSVGLGEPVVHHRAPSASSGTSAPLLDVRAGPPRRARCRPGRGRGTGRPIETCGRPSSLGQAARLGALAGARRAEHHEDLRRSATLEAAAPREAPGSPDEALVVAHHQLGLELLHRLDDHRDHDEQGRAAEAEASRRRRPRRARTG